MTTIGQGSNAMIAGACDDGMVRIYNSITGGLRLSLRPEFPILEMTGVPDGSLLVCTHSGRPVITLWDLQTGGLVQTFILKEEVKRTAVSLRGRYLACETFERAVIFWETASRTQHPEPLEKLEGHTPCWLAPEELIMVVDRGSAYIRNVATKGPPVRRFDLLRSAYSAIYSQTFDLLAIMSPHFLGHSFTIIDVTAGTSSTLRSGGERLSLVAFSQTTKQLVCSGEASRLETVDISTGCWTRFNFPATFTSISTLSNGTVVVNAQGSDIQLLRLHQGHASSQQPTPPLLTTYLLDEGRIVAIVPASNDRVILLEASTMSQVLSIPTQEDLPIATGLTAVLCASLKKKIAVYSFAAEGYGKLQIWEFSREYPRWTEMMSGSAPVASISPFCTRLVTLHNRSSGGCVQVWDMHRGEALAQMVIDDPRACPLDIAFGSENRVHFYYGSRRESYQIVPTENGPYPFFIIRYARERLSGQVLEEYYSLDDGREWVVCGSKRICWVPPGSSHCWVGSSLIMVGQDGMFRKLTFPEPPV